MWLLAAILYLSGFIILGALLFGSFMLLVAAYKIGKAALLSDPKAWK
jgi:hypothetical protein